MSQPVKNWNTVVNGIPIFSDIVDADLRHYGPRPVWRELSRKDLGQTKAIFSGVIDLGYTSDELQSLAGSLAGKKIMPLALSGISDEPIINFGISPPHAGGITPLSSLPFPQYRLSITIDLRAGDSATLIDNIQNGWAKRALLRGRFAGSADGCIAKAGYRVIIDPKSCIAEVGSTEGKQLFSKPDAWKAVTAAVLKRRSEWINYYGAAEEPNDVTFIDAALIELLFERCFEDWTLVRYDNGFTASGSRLREIGTLVAAEARIFVQSSSAKVGIYFDF